MFLLQSLFPNVFTKEGPGVFCLMFQDKFIKDLLFCFQKYKEVAFFIQYYSSSNISEPGEDEIMPDSHL